MARGGKRAGAGRKEGSKTKKTCEIAERAKAEGITPLEVMLDNMRFAHEKAGEILAEIIGFKPEEKPDLSPEQALETFKELIRFRMIAQDAAKDAAPYIHPRLNAVTHKGDPDNPVEVNQSTKITAQEAKALAKALDGEY